MSELPSKAAKSLTSRVSSLRHGPFDRFEAGRLSSFFEERRDSMRKEADEGDWLWLDATLHGSRTRRDLYNDFEIKQATGMSPLSPTPRVPSGQGSPQTSTDSCDFFVLPPLMRCFSPALGSWRMEEREFRWREMRRDEENSSLTSSG